MALSKRLTPPDDTYVEDHGFTGRGSVMEDAFIVPYMTYVAKEYGGRLLYAGQADQITLVSNKVPVSCTPDGLLADMPRDFLVEYGVLDIGADRSVVCEFKSISPRYNKDKLPKHEHVHQIMVQLGMIRRATEHRPEYGIVVYVDADKYTDVRIYVVAYSDKHFKGLVKRADVVLKTKEPQVLPPEGKTRGGSECALCQYAKQCLGYRPYVADDDPKAPTKKQVEAVARIAKKVKELEDKEDAAKKARLEAEGDLYLTLGGMKRNFVSGSGYTVQAKVTKSQMRSDSKKLIALLKEKGATEAEIEACKSATKEGTSLSVERVA